MNHLKPSEVIALLQKQANPSLASDAERLMRMCSEPGVTISAGSALRDDLLSAYRARLAFAEKRGVASAGFASTLRRVVSALEHETKDHIDLISLSVRDFVGGIFLAETGEVLALLVRDQGAPQGG